MVRAEGSVQRGKPLYFERPWQRVLDEMEDAGVFTVGALNAARVWTLSRACPRAPDRRPPAATAGLPATLAMRRRNDVVGD